MCFILTSRNHVFLEIEREMNITNLAKNEHEKKKEEKMFWFEFPLIKQFEIQDVNSVLSVCWLLQHTHNADIVLNERLEWSWSICLHGYKYSYVGFHIYLQILMALKREHWTGGWIE